MSHPADTKESLTEFDRPNEAPGPSNGYGLDYPIASPFLPPKSKERSSSNAPAGLLPWPRFKRKGGQVIDRWTGRSYRPASGVLIGVLNRLADPRENESEQVAELTARVERQAARIAELHDTAAVARQSARTAADAAGTFEEVAAAQLENRVRAENEKAELRKRLAAAERELLGWKTRRGLVARFVGLFRRKRQAQGPAAPVANPFARHAAPVGESRGE